MNLTESDVGAIANNRYWTKRRTLKFLGVLLGVLVLVTAVMAITKSPWAALVLLIAVVYMLAELRNVARFRKELVKQWKKERNV